ncbi:hypothetical protein [Micromonospora sp. DT62]|uniref:hypothetical protein n=1 Tax=Micromonospora sp. DT62 TaxID=3416521 RepID=UPI003CF9CA31
MSDDFSHVMQKGTYREQLEAIRDLLAERLVKAFPKDAAGIAKQLGEVLAELEQLNADEEGSSPLDELLASREADASDR